MSWLSWYHVCSGKMTAQDKTTSQCSSLLPLSVHFLLIPQFNQQVLAQTCWFPVSSASFLLLGDGELLFSQKGVLKELSILFCSFGRKNTQGDLNKFFFFKTAWSSPSWSWASWLHSLSGPYSSRSQTQPEHGYYRTECFYVSTSTMISHALVSTRSNNVSPLVDLSDIWTRKLSSVHSRSLLDCLQPTMLLSQQIFGIEIPHQDESLWEFSSTGSLRPGSL